LTYARKELKETNAGEEKKVTFFSPPKPAAADWNNLSLSQKKPNNSTACASLERLRRRES
jgi:hypothetical protein